ATRKPEFRSVGQSIRTLTPNASKEQHDDRLDSYRCEREIASAGEKRLLPEYSAAVIGSSVVLRLFAGGVPRSIVCIAHCALCHPRRCARVGRGEQNGHGLREPAPQPQLSRMRFPMVRWFAAFASIFILSMVPPPGSNTAFGQDRYPTRPVKF